MFGIGIVETSEDFGVRASTPSHPELLDWLAVDFMEHDWSLKHLLRTIVTSATYRQDSRFTDELLERDPNNRLLARGPRFRVDAEVARDTVLAASGLLNRQARRTQLLPAGARQHVRHELHTGGRLLEDGPGAGAISPIALRIPPPVDARPGSSVVRRTERRLCLRAADSLQYSVGRAFRAERNRIRRRGTSAGVANAPRSGSDDRERADYAFKLCTNRSPTDAEIDEILSLYRSQRQRLADGWISPRAIATGDTRSCPNCPRASALPTRRRGRSSHASC